MDAIIIHHSATVDGKSFSWRAIRNYHVNTRGWLDVGYHAGVELMGTEYECLYGRPVTMQGAHAQGHNHDTLGFCFVGNYDLKDPDNEMLYVAARRVLVPWLVEYRLPLTEIHGHREYANKSCPGKLFSIDNLREVCASVMAG